MILTKKYLSFRQRLSRFLQSYPSLLLLVGILNGVVPLVLHPELGLLKASLLLLAVSIGLLLLLSSRFIAKFLIFSLLGLLAMAFHLRLPEDHYVRVIPRPECGANIEVVVTDTSCTDKELSWLPNPRLLRAEVIRMRYTDSAPWQVVTGKLAIRLPVDSPRVEYGEHLELTGKFIEPESPVFKGGFDFKRFLLVRGIYREFIAREVMVLPDSRWTFLGPLLAIRDYLIDRLTSGISSLKNRRMLAALTFGCKQGIDWKTRQNFIFSGSIHIFTVSGLHVGMLALLLFWVLRPLPFRIRFIVLPFLLLFYVLTIGCHPSAVRALLMISIWSFHRAFLYRTNPLNIVMFAAAFLLLINPFYLVDLGFQFSFITVGFLVFSVKSINQWLELLSERLRWIPSANHSWPEKFRFRIVRLVWASLAGCSIAWLASCGISLWQKGIFTPSAVLANFLIIPFVWLLFILLPFHLLLLSIPILGQICSWLIESLLNLIGGICRFFALHGGSFFISQPPLWSLVVFYGALLLLATAYRKKPFLAALSLLSSIMIFWHLSREFSPTEIVIFHGGQSQQPGIVICDQRNNRSVVINAPSKEISRQILGFLNSRGVNRIGSLIFCANRKECCAGAGYLAACCPIEELIMAADYRRSRYAITAVNRINQQGARLRKAGLLDSEQKSWHLNTGRIYTAVTTGDWNTEYQAADLAIQVRVHDRNDGTKRVEIKTSDGESRKVELENSYKVTMRKVR